MKNRRSAPNLCREALPLKLPRCSLIRALLHMFFDRLSRPFLGGSELILLSRLLFRAYLNASEQRREVLVVLKLVERIVVALGLDDRHEQIAVFVARHREAHAYAVPVDISYAAERAELDLAVALELAARRRAHCGKVLAVVVSGVFYLGGEVLAVYHGNMGVAGVCREAVLYHGKAEALRIVADLDLYGRCVLVAGYEAVASGLELRRGRGLLRCRCGLCVGCCLRLFAHGEHCGGRRGGYADGRDDLPFFHGGHLQILL